MGLSPRVETPEYIRTGGYANAVRIVSDESGCLLDFLAYSEYEGAAVIVTRVRVSKDFLPLIREHIIAAIAA